MNTKRILGIVLLIVGAVLLYFGLQSTDSFGEKIVEGVTGRYSDGTMGYLIGGAVSAAIGLGLLVLVRRTRAPRLTPVKAAGATVKLRFWVTFDVPVVMATFVAICSPASAALSRSQSAHTFR